MSLIENLLENLGANLKSIETFVFFWNKAKTYGLIWKSSFKKQLLKEKSLFTYMSY